MRVNTQQSDWVARGRGCRFWLVSRGCYYVCLVTGGGDRKSYCVCLVDKAPLVLAGKFSCVLAGNVPTCAWCFGVHTKNIGGGVISTEVYPMIVEGATILLVSSEGV